MLLESFQRVQFNRVYFIILRAKVWETLLIFESIFWLKIQTNCKTWVWKEKSVEPSMCFTLLNLENFNFENMKNKKCVHTWANSTGYTSLEIIEMNFGTFFFFNHMSLKRQDFGIFTMVPMRVLAHPRQIPNT
jgi:hypothetical protein